MAAASRPGRRREPARLSRMRIEISGLLCRYGGLAAVGGVDLTVEDGEFLAILGPSGSGKTTLLRALAGLVEPEAGRILFDGADATHLPVNRRGIGFVFQNYALFRHMSVADNIAFGLKVRPRAQRPDRRETAARVEKLLELVQLPGMGRRSPDQLSGGQRQRVALARALAIEPKLLLLDEPFGALDAQVRTELRLWLKSLHQQLRLTAVFVTHDQEEAMEIADRIVVMRNGRVEQVDRPAALYANPTTPFVFGFLGQTNRLPATVRRSEVRLDRYGLAVGHEPRLADGPALALFRPHRVALAPPGAEGDWGRATVVALVPVGDRLKLTLDAGGEVINAELGAEAAANLDLAPGSAIDWRPQDPRIYPA